MGLGFGEVAASVSSSVGLDAVYPQAYALVGVAAMLAGTCQVGPQTSLNCQVPSAAVPSFCPTASMAILMR